MRPLMKAIFEQDYIVCLTTCPPADFDCINSCVREYQQKTETCPCQSGCPNGCPCPDYLCPATTTQVISTTLEPSRTSVLILNTQGKHPEAPHTPVVTDLSGKIEYPVDDFMFMYGKGTEVWKSCSLTWRGQFYIFGGQNEKTQVSTLNGCKLERVASLNFQFVFGGCANVDERQIYLCFSENLEDSDQCRYAEDPIENFTEVTRSNFDHLIKYKDWSESRLKIK